MEVRAVWLTTNWNIDYPKTSGANSQKAELITLLDKLKAANFNTVMFQVRARGDLTYPSSLEPFAISMTGSLGGNPGFDPLQFAITEAHKRGMELHAWWCVYRVYSSGNPANTNPKHIVLKRPDLCKQYGSEWWMDPGLPDTKTYLLNVAVEMIRKYEIDGIHFDHIRYPNPDFNDAQTYTQYGGGMNKSDWRRNNINQFVYALYDSVQAIRPSVKVGSAPIGIYKDLSTSGWDGYSQVFQDSRRWLIAKKHDYLTPQIYWDINTCPRFDSLSLDWISYSSGRHIYPGIASYRMGANDGNWSSSEILNQIDTTRGYNGLGNVFYHTSSILNNYKSIYNLLKTNQYFYPANIPPMQWKDNVKPNSPLDLTISTLDSLTFTLQWSKPLPATDGDTIKYYNVYRDIKQVIDFSDIKNVIKFQVVADTSINVVFNSKPSQNYYFAVTSYDKGYNESDPSNVVGIVINAMGSNDLMAYDYQLYQNYPNPFNPSTIISYQLKKAGMVTLKVYDVLGNEVSVLVNSFQSEGMHKVEFNSANLASGIYFYRIQTGEFNSIKKMVIIK